MRDARRLQLLAIVAALLATMAAWALAPAMATTPAEALVPEGSESAPAAATAPGVARSDADEPSWLLPFLGRPEADRVRALAAGERGGSGLRGRLVARWLHQPWQPLADVEVLLTSSWLDTVLPLHVGDAEEPLPPLYGPRTRTDAQGGFSFRIAVESDELFLLIGRGTEWHEFRKARHLPRAGETVDLGTIYLDERGSVTGSVVDAANQPVADVEVRAVDAPLLDPDLDQRELRELRSAGLERFKPRGFFADAPLPRWVAQRDQLLPFPRTRSGADGQFVLPGLRATSHDLFLSGGELAGSVHEVLVRGGERTDLGRIRLVGGRPVSGIVIDEQQRPWIGARVTAIDDDFALGPAAVPVDWHGNFVLRGLAQQRPGTLLFQHPAGGPWLPIGKLTPERREPGRFVVDAPQTMRFRIVDQTRAALPQAEVRAFVVAGGLRPQDMLLPPFFQPQREADGSFRLRQMSGATTVLVATAGGFAPGIGRAPPDQGTILLLPAVRMRVRTVDVAGAPVADAKVIAQLQRHPTLDFPGAQW
ncbi:MAG TPA: hypothetical protein VK348_15110, partial [Planctomycetota bacterium]|nr:hypothetical protein [Planctomycetota bacterium]